MDKFYTGIGTRAENLPTAIEQEMKLIGKALAEKGYTLRSGAASGADSAFEEGAIAGEGAGEIFLPWSKFRNRYRNKGFMRYLTLGDKRFEVAREYWKASGIIGHFDKMSGSSQLFHARNYYQITGITGEPSEFVVYYAPMDLNREPMGGTRSAVLRGWDLEVPTFNLGIEAEARAFEKYWRG